MKSGFRLLNIVSIISLLLPLWAPPVGAFDGDIGTVGGMSGTLLPSWFSSPILPQIALTNQVFAGVSPLSQEVSVTGDDVTDEIAPAVTCDFHNSCLAVWEVKFPTTSTIQGRWLNGYGELGNIASLGGSGAENRCFPDLAYNQDTDEFLVLYTEGDYCNSGYAEIRSQRVSAADGYVYSPNLLRDSGQYANIVYVNSSHPYLALYKRPDLSIEAQWLDSQGTTEAVFSLPSQGSYPRSVSDGEGAFVVWRTSDLKVAGCYLTAGATTCSHFTIAPEGGYPELPDVAYASSSHYALTVWRQYEGNGEYGIYGRLITNTAAVGSPFFIGEASSLSQPSVEFHQRDNTFLVTWNRDGILYGQYASDLGVPLTSDGNFGRESLALGNTDDSTAIAGRRNDLSLNDATELFVATWVITDSNRDIHAQYVEPLSLRDLAVQASRRPEDSPAAAYGSDQYLATFVDTASPTPTIRVRIADLEESFVHSTAWLTLPLTGTLGYTQPAVVSIPPATGGEGRYILAATAILSGETDIYVWLIDESGNITATSPVSASGDQSHPALAYNPATQRVVLVWQDENSQHIWKRVMDSSGVPIGNDTEFSFSPAANYPSVHPDIASGGDYFLVAWESTKDAEQQITVIRLRAVDGDFYDSEPHISVEDPYQHQTHPAVTYNDDQDVFSVAWHSARDDNIHVATVNAAGDLNRSASVFEDSALPCYGKPAILYSAGPDGGEFYVAASCSFTDTTAIRARRLDATGVPFGREIVASHDAGLGSQHQPVMVHDANNHILFLWSDERYGPDDADIFGRLLTIEPDLSASSIEVLPEIAIQQTLVTVTARIDNSDGLTEARDVNSTITLPENVTYTSHLTGSCVYSPSTGNVHWIVDVPDMEQALCSFKVRLGSLAVLPNGTYLTFTMRVGVTGTAPLTRTDSLMVSSNPRLVPDLKVDKAVAIPGEVLTYTVTITNEGAKAFDVVGNLLIPPGTAFVPGSAHPTATPAGREISFTWGTVAGREVVTASYQVTVVKPAPDGWTVTNYFTVTEHYWGQSTSVATTSISSQVDLTPSRISPSRRYVSPSDYIVYTLAITNDGTLTATNPVVVGIDVPTYTTLISYNIPACTYSNAQVACDFRNPLLIGQSDYVTVLLRVDSVVPNGSLILFDGIFSATEALTPYLASAPPVTVTSSPSLEVTHYGPHVTREVCDGLYYYFRLNNNAGNEHATGTVVTMTIHSPVSLTLRSSSHPYEFTPPQPHTGTLQLPSDEYTIVLSIGQVWANDDSYEAINIYGDVNELITDSTVLTATFWVDSDQTEPFSWTVATTLRSLCLNKWSSPYYVEVGDIHVYYNTVECRNTTTCTDVHLYDLMPDGVKYLDSTCTDIQSPGGCSLGDLSSWMSRTEAVTVEILPPLWYGYIYNDSEAWWSGNITDHVWGGDGIRVRIPDFRGSWMEADPTATPADTVVAERITYTLHLYNGGLADGDARFTMTLPALTTIVSCPGASSTGGNTAIWQISNVTRYAAPLERYCVVEVNAPLENGTVLTGSAVIASSKLAYTVTRWATSTYRSAPLFDFTKSVMPHGPVPPHTAVTYTITITNIGDENATGAVITDAVPAGATFRSASEGKTPVGGILTWGPIPLPVGGKAVYTFSVESPVEGVIAGQARSFANQAFVHVDQIDEWIPSTVASNAILTITKIVTPSPVRVGDLLTWTIFITNASTTAITDVSVRDRVPHYTTFVAAYDGGIRDGDVITWPTFTLSGSTTVSFSFVVRVANPLTDGTILRNYDYGVQLCSDCASFLPGQPVEVLAYSREHLSIDLSASPVPTIEVGQTSRYTLTLINDGGENARGVEITLTLPTGLSNVTCHDGTLIGDTCHWTNVQVPVGVTQTVWAEARPALTLPNRSLLVSCYYGAMGEDGPAEVGRSITQVVIAPVVLSATLIAPDLVIPGRSVTYTLIVTNAGDAPLENANVSYIRPAQVSDWTLVNNQNNAALPPGESRSWVIAGGVSFPLADNYPLPLTFVLSATNLPASLPITATAYVTNVPDLSESSIALARPYADLPDGRAYSMTLTYEVILRNTGSTTATNTSVWFNAPVTDGVYYVPGSLSGLESGWLTMQSDTGFTATNGEVPLNGSQAFSFSVRLAVLEHAPLDVMYGEFPVHLHVDLDATRHPAPLPRLETLDYVYDTGYRPELCALSSVNDSETTSIDNFRGIFGIHAYRKDSQRMYKELFEPATQGGICDGMVFVSGRYFVGDDEEEFGYWPTPPEACTLYLQDYDPYYIWYVAVKWQGAQVAQNVMHKKGKKVSASEMVNILIDLFGQDDGSGPGVAWQLNSVILGLEQNALSCSRDVVPVGHSVLPYRVVQGGDWAYIYVYDPNHPRQDGTPPNIGDALNRYIIVNMQTGEWVYPLGNVNDVAHTWRGTYFRYARLDDYRTARHLPMNRNSDSILVNGLKMRWCASPGGAMECRTDDTWHIGIDDAYRYIPAEGLESGEHSVFLLPDDDYEFTTSIITPGDINPISVYGPRFSFHFESRMQEYTIQMHGDGLAVTRSQYDGYDFDDFTATVYKRGVAEPYSYTMAYDLEGGPLKSGHTITLTPYLPTPDGSNPDRFEIILDPSAQPLTYNLHVSWDWVNSSGEYYSGTERAFLGMVIEPRDRHVLFVHDRENLDTAVICIDKENDGFFDTCMDLDAWADPPASTSHSWGETFTGEPITYTVAFFNTATTPLETLSELHAVVPTYTTIVSGSVQCIAPLPVTCTLDYNITHTRRITATYGPGLPPGDTLYLQYTVVVTGSAGDVIEMTPWGKTELTPPVYTDTLVHHVINRPPITPFLPSPADGATQVTLTHPLSWTSGDLDGDLLTYTVRWRPQGEGNWTTIVTTATLVTPTFWLSGTVYEWYVDVDDGIDVVHGPHWWFTAFNHAPYTPTNPTPRDGAENVPVSSALTWQGGDRDTNQSVLYTVVLDTQCPPHTVVATGQTITSYHPNLLPHTRYCWVITASDGISETGGPTWVFTTANQAPTLSNFTPPSGTTDAPTNQTLSWQGNDADGDPLVYTLYFGTVSPPPPVLSGTTDTSFNPGRLPTDTVHYWRVLASDGISTVESGLLVFTTSTTLSPNNPPNVPADPSPFDGETGVPTGSLPFAWSGGDPDLDPVTYTVTLRRVYPSEMVSECVTTSPVCTFTDLVAGATYEWRVVANDPYSQTVGPWWRFSTINQAPYVHTPTPAMGAVNVPITQVLSWLGGDPDVDGNPVAYDVALGTSTSPPFVGSTPYTHYNPAHQLLTYTTYYWVVTATDHISTVVSTLWSFTTVPTWYNNHHPYTPTNCTPPDGATGVPVSQSLSIVVGDPDKDPLENVIHLFSPAGEITGVVTSDAYDINGYATVEYDLGGLLPHTAYTWFVVSNDRYSSTVGAICAFSTANRPPHQPSNPDPADGAVQVPLTKTLRWDGGDDDGDSVTYTVSIRGSDGFSVTDVVPMPYYTPTGLVTATRYTWNVTATDGLSTAYGGPWQFTTVNRPPYPLTDLTPPDGDTGVPITETITWTGGDPDGGTVTYTIAFGPTDPPPVVVPATTTTSYDPGTLLPHTTYYVIITATDGLTFSVTSWHFTTANHSPVTPTNPYPPDGDTQTPLTTTFTWEGGDPDITEPVVTYTVGLWSGGTLVDTGVVLTTTWDPGYRLALATPYTWTVTATDGFSTTIGPVWAFTTTATPQPNLPPDAPYDPTPDDGASNVPLTQTLRWSGGDPNKDPITYTVIVTRGGVTIINDATTASWYDPGQLLTATLYTWRVIASDGLSQTVGPLWQFTTTITPQQDLPPYEPTPLYPADGASDIPDFVTLQWSGGDPNKDAVTYTVAFGASDPPPVVHTTTDEEYIIPGRLEAGRTYYWQVAATDGSHVVTGAVWSFTTSITPTPNHCPAEVTRLAPEQAAGLPYTVTLRWESSDPDGDDLRYILVLGTRQPTPEDPLPVITSTQGTSYTVANLRGGTTYYWRVDAYDGQCLMSGAVWTFTVVNRAPAVPTPIAPPDGAVNVPLTETLAWECSDPDGNPLVYDVAFGTSTRPPLVSAGTPYTTHIPGLLCPHTTYHWAITAADGLSLTASPVYSFTTSNHAPYRPGNLTPAGGVRLPLDSVVLSWNGGDPDPECQPLIYTIYLWSADLPTVTYSTGDTFYSLSGLARGKTYYWRVAASDGVSVTAGSTLSFTITNERPNQPSNPIPPDGAQWIPLTQTLSWAGGDPDGQAVTYTVSLRCDNGLRISATVVNATVYTPTGLTTGTLCTWGVTATDGITSVYGGAWQFITTFPLTDLIANPSPGDGESGVPFTETISWGDGDVPAGLSVTYTIAFGPVDPPPVVTTTHVMSYDPGPLCPHTTYYWQITVTNGISEAVASPVYHFTTSNTAPDVPGDFDPAAGAVQVPISPTLTWSGGDPDPECSPLVYTVTWGANGWLTESRTLTGTALLLTDLSYDTTYSWQVAASDGVSVTTGPVLTFTTVAAETGTPILEVAPDTLAFTATVGGVSPVGQQIQVTNVGSGTLTWQATVPPTSPLASHVTLSPTSGTAPSTVTVSLDTGGLGAGAYTAAIVISGQVGVSRTPQIVPVTLYMHPMRLYLPVVLRNSDLACISWEHEPNNEYTESEPIQFGPTYCGNMKDDGEYPYSDLFSFTMSDTRTITISLKPGELDDKGCNYDLYLLFWNPDLGDEGKWVTVNKSTGPTASEFLTATIGPLPLPYDKYIVRVYRATQEEGGGDLRYHLKVTTADD